jgi:hypothetical protein
MRKETIFVQVRVVDKTAGRRESGEKRKSFIEKWPRVHGRTEK